jgi:hypothetical protein
MKKVLLSAVLGAAGLVPMAASAHTDLSISVGFGVPIAAPVVYEPAPVVEYAPPPPVYYAPRPVYYAPGPAVYARPAAVVYRSYQGGYYGGQHYYGHRHCHERYDD